MRKSMTKSDKSPSTDPLARFKEAQREGWAHFAPLETLTTPAAAELVRRASPRAGQRVLDVACGTGVVAVTAARSGARVTGLDLTPELLERARENARIAGVEIEWHQGDDAGAGAESPTQPHGDGKDRGPNSQDRRVAVFNRSRKT